MLLAKICETQVELLTFTFHEQVRQQSCSNGMEEIPPKQTRSRGFDVDFMGNAYGNLRLYYCAG